MDFLSPAAPVAQAAEWLVQAWLAAPKVRLVLVDEARQSAFLDALRARVCKLEPLSECSSDDLADAILQVVDTGACLIAGGHGKQPALATNLRVHPTLLRLVGQPLPLLMVGTMEENAAELPPLRPFFRSFPPSSPSQNTPHP